MELQPFAVDRHVEESLRLFHVSTMDAALSGSLSGVEGFTTQDGKLIDIFKFTNFDKQIVISF